MDTITRPKTLMHDHLSYLDDLRDSGETNMFGAAPYLKREFPDLTRNDARDIVLYWMATFDERHP